ncbi:MAG: AI-2E family transporter [Lachnospiraceae bacterium]|nr:AI-2E family transporter [Lachnospiraceae bacterium]
MRDTMRFRGWKNQNWFPYTVAACSAVALFVILMNLQGIGGVLGTFFGYFSPVVIGMIVAYIIDPLVMFVQRKLLRRMKNETLARTLAVVLSLLIVVLLLVLILSSLIPQLVNSLATFIGNFDEYSKHIQKSLNHLNSQFSTLHLDLSGLLQSGTNVLNNITEKLPTYLNKIANASSTVGGHVMNWVMGIILAVYFLVDKKRLIGGLKQLLKLLLSGKKYLKASSFWKRCNAIMIKYIVCELLEGLVVGGLNFVFMLIMGMPYAVLVSVVVGVTNMIPTFGPVIGAAIGGLILLLVDPWKALAFLIFTVILQTIDGYILKPKMYGETLGVPSILILVSIIVGGKMFGVAGILLAIPFAAIISFVYVEALIPWLESRRRQKDMEQGMTIKEINRKDEKDHVSENEEI